MYSPWGESEKRREVEATVCFLGDGIESACGGWVRNFLENGVGETELARGEWVRNFFRDGVGDTE